ncbi:uncharacterized protein F54H12.2-like [Nematostella vectensis]|uniref:uncharacterized protein F54H12.2-like n=1 Tax=Nematostella vectensis TaxID=45351 RepID=UPI0020774B6D|nr:uncharacterized protein F54H12.2-like [Nematostella vectensis]XP_032234372.2 uncharacterized protein F54H12.2-like [Nematostella vectensis]XP_048579151.1 uncharacterized protein F54H12.2-like [Nematostella vectensis]
MSTAHVLEGSQQVANPGMGLFTMPATDVALKDGKFIPYTPSDESSNHIEWYIHPTTTYIDLQKTHIKLKVKITKTNNQNLTADEAATFVNNVGHSLFKQVKVELNNMPITLQTDSYPFKAYISNLLNYTREGQDSFLGLSLWHKDTAGKMDVTAVTGAGATNKGLIKRNSYTALSAEVGLIINLDVDLFKCGRYLLSGVPMKIRLEMATPAFALMGSGKFVITPGSTLRLYHVTPTDTIGLTHGTALVQHKLAKYPVTTAVVKTEQVESGKLTKRFNDLWNGLIPKRMVFGLITNAAYAGDYDKNPYNFFLTNVTNIELRVNGVETPFTSIKNIAGDAIDLYYMMHEGINGKTGRTKGLNINRDEFFGGYGLIVYDLTAAGNASSGYFQPQYKGTVSLDLTFSTAPTEVLTVVLYGEFNNVMEIDAARRVMYTIQG